MENTIKQFCNAWLINDFDKMYTFCQITWKSKYTKWYLQKLLLDKIQGFEIVSVEFDEKYPCICDINIKVKYKGLDKELKARLIKESKPRTTSEEGTWGVNPISVLRNLYM